MSIVLWILAVDLVALTVTWLMCRAAPLGYQDRRGFHRGMPPESKSSEADSRDLLPKCASSMLDRFSGHRFSTHFG